MEGESQRVWTGTLAPGESLAKEETSVLGSTLPVTLGISPCDLGPQSSAFALCPLVSNALSLGASALRFFFSTSSFSLSPLSLLSIPLPASPSTSPFLPCFSLSPACTLFHTHSLSILLTRKGPLWDPGARPAPCMRRTCLHLPAIRGAGAQPPGWSVTPAGGLFPLTKGRQELAWAVMKEPERCLHSWRAARNRP